MSLTVCKLDLANRCNRDESEVRRYEKEYTPLLPEDVEREPPPRRPTRDTYLQSRLSRFYAEVAQYQPGVDRAMYEGKLLNMGGGLLPPLPEPCVPLRGSLITCTQRGSVLEVRAGVGTICASCGWVHAGSRTQAWQCQQRRTCATTARTLALSWAVVAWVRMRRAAQTHSRCTARRRAGAITRSCPANRRIRTARRWDTNAVWRHC